MNIRELNAYDFYTHFNKVLTEASNFLFQRYVGNENSGDEIKLIFDMGCCYFEAKRRYYVPDDDDAADDSVDDQNYDTLEKLMYKFSEAFPEITLLKDILDIVGYSEAIEKKFIEDYRNEYDWDEDEEESEEDDEESEEDDED